MHAMSKRFVLIADSSKKVKFLGKNFSVPVEILPSAQAYVSKKLTELGAQNLHNYVKGRANAALYLQIMETGSWMLASRSQTPLGLKQRSMISQVS